MMGCHWSKFEHDSRLSMKRQLFYYSGTLYSLVTDLSFLMPPVSCRKRMIKQMARDQGIFISTENIEQPEAEGDETVDMEDWQLLELSDDMIFDAYNTKFLTWKHGADSGLRSVYRKDSRTIFWRRKRAAQQQQERDDVEKPRTFLEYGFSVQSRQEEAEEAIEHAQVALQDIKLKQIESAHSKLSLELLQSINSAVSVKGAYEHCRLLAVRLYFSYR